ncbi:exodeoxyribonuclease VII large subunit [Sporanaerobium hydrogeniformans]|uniref:Exodeoxyribonuclease VII large subunit n=1 Tax=Sporanaerobium hydrogeniformans TaxID=3072179 RepID=A0AC61DGH8_9FIRM|nr:exodeoxyribonuclease VII large subunit [Sporanaerobium hydrogeniformans]PHV72364.1 exodeoxyribonuclease VII large subunit [Sporanaerobium hydrogeniformans]
MKRKILSVWQLNHYVSGLIEQDYMLSDVWVSGEISNCKYHQSGHVYFTLKDERASINAVLFERDAQKLTFHLVEGMKIFARARLAIYEKTGAYQAYVFDVEKQGKGLLYEQFEALKKRLEQEGLFDTQYKKPIPKYPKRVGIITSATGAAIEDICQISKRRNASIPLYIYPVHVQGDLAVPEIIAAIRKANEDDLVDVLIVGRGGGSIEDLWAFNEEEVARTIFNSRLPIVSAVGHEIDFTIADFVSDLRAATPSAAAELVIYSQAEVKEQVERYAAHLTYMMKQQLGLAQGKLEALLNRPVYRSKDKYYKDKMQEVDLLMQQLHKEYKHQVQDKVRLYELALEKLEKLSPLTTLKRGYSLVTNERGQVVTSIKMLEKGEHLQLTLKDGSIGVQVQEEVKTNG